MDTNQSQPIIPRQTINALYVQLHESGHSTSDLLRIQRGYRLVCIMFNGRYRKNERPFICHAVGAASSVAHVDRRVEVILAAMLHAAFDSGQFPDGRNGGHSDAHKTWLADQVGADVADLAARYDRFRLEHSDLKRLADDWSPDGDEDIVLLRLAHEIDDLADGGLAFAPKYGNSIAGRAEACTILAHRIGQPRMAEAILRLAAEFEAISWADELRPAQLRGYRVAPSFRAYLRLRRAHRRGDSVKIF